MAPGPSHETEHEESLSTSGSRSWRIALAMFLVTAIVYGVAIYGFIILSQPLAAEMGYSHIQSGNLVSAMWLVAPLALFCAPLIGRLGAWRILLVGLVIDAAAFASITLTDQFWQLYALRMVMGVGKTLAIVAMPVIISQWFTRRFGTAIAFAWCGGSFGGLVVAPLAETLARELGWRSAVLWLSALVVVTALVIGLLGRSAGAPGTVEPLGPSTAEHKIAARPGFTEIRSINRVTASLMAFAVLMSGIGAISFVIQAPTLMESIGYSPTMAAAVLGFSSAGAIAGQLSTGWMLDRARVRTVSAVTALLILSGLFAFHLLEQRPLVWAAIAAALVFGAGMGACEVLWITLTKRQFGTALFAITYGAWSFSYQIGYAAGGGISGAIYELGNPAIFLAAIGVFYAPALVLSIWRPSARNEAD
jgi:predicted MFS family arabinose efflux permease